MRNKLLIIMGFIMLVGFMTIGFFIFPMGITLCGIIGTYYGYRKSDQLFLRWSALALVVGIALIIYTLCLIGSM